jgi:hypothetical protein
MKKPTSIKRPRLWWHVPLDFFIHGVVGFLISCAIGAPAVMLGFVVEKLEEFGVPHFTILVLTSVEKFILLVDAAAVICYVAISTYRELKAIFQHDDGDEGA